MGSLDSKIYIVLLLMSTESASASPPALLERATQCLVVLAKDWSSKGGELHLLDRSSTKQPWTMVSAPRSVSLGRGGLAPGVGWPGLPAPAGLQKTEGDDRSPAGLFALGRAFGFAASPPTPRYSYLPLTRTLEAIDDPRSRYYNQIVDVAQTPERDWQGSEKMRSIPTYRRGLIIEYNTRNPQPGRGSCIFFHCWKSPHEPTSGCTGMAEDDLKGVLQWLDADSHPVLLQMPRATYVQVRNAWSLPELR